MKNETQFFFSFFVINKMLCTVMTIYNNTVITIHNNEAIRKYTIAILRSFISVICRVLTMKTLFYYSKFKKRGFLDCLRIHFKSFALLSLSASG